ncbi:MAG: nucleotide exchange factor GrpE [Candidatus Spechtbacterales bacterium]
MNSEPEYINEEDETDAAGAKVKKVKKQLKAAEKERKEYLDGWQRERASFANYKKDIEKYITEMRGAVREDALLTFLPILDNLELALSHTPEDIAGTPYHKGIEHIVTQIRQYLTQMGVEEMPVKEGDTFDPNKHEAVDGEGETIAEVVQKGYMINGSILRVAKVKVK